MYAVVFAFKMVGQNPQKCTNLINILLDPKGYIQQRLAMANAILHPVDTFNNVKDSVATPFNDNLINGSGNDRARYLGSATLNAATMFTAAGPAKVGSLAGKTFSKAGPALSKAKTTFNPFLLDERGSISFGKLQPVEVTVRYTPVMSKSQYRKKMMALEDLSDQGVLVKTSNYVRDADLTYEYRKDLAGRMWRQYAIVNKPFAEKMRKQIFARNMHPDHVWELQLGGPDTTTNLKMLHAGTNTSVGSQIGNQMRKYPDGTPIIIKWVE